MYENGKYYLLEMQCLYMYSNNSIIKSFPYRQTYLTNLHLVYCTPLWQISGTNIKVDWVLVLLWLCFLHHSFYWLQNYGGGKLDTSNCEYVNIIVSKWFPEKEELAPFPGDLKLYRTICCRMQRPRVLTISIDVIT